MSHGGEKPLSRVLVVSSRADAIAQGYANAFQRRGCQTRVFDLGRANHWVDRYIFHAVNHWAHNFRIVPKSRDLFFGHPLSHRVYRSRQLLAAVGEFAPDLVFHIRSWTLLPETLREIRAACRLFGWWVEGDHRVEEALPAVPDYDRFYFFSTGCVDLARERGLERVGYLRHAVDTTIFYPLPERPPEYDWVFVGKWTEHRQRVVEELARVSGSFALYGPGWEANAGGGDLLARFKGKGVWGRELVELYARAKVVVNVTQWKAGGQALSGMNVRVLEAMACGRCLLTDLTGDAGELLEPGRQMEVFLGLDDVGGRLRGLLQDQARRESLARAGLEAARQRFSYDARVEELAADFAALAPGAATGEGGA